MVTCSRKLKWVWDLEETHLQGRGEEGGWEFGMGETKARLRTPGQQQTELAPSALALALFPSGAPPWRCSPLSPLSSLSATLLVLCRCAPSFPVHACPSLNQGP